MHFLVSKFFYRTLHLRGLREYYACMISSIPLITGGNKEGILLPFSSMEVSSFLFIGKTSKSMYGNTKEVLLVSSRASFSSPRTADGPK